MYRFALLAFLATSPCVAQTSFGVRAGLNVSMLGDFQIDEQRVDEVPRLGPAVSAFARIPLGEAFAVQPEVGYVTRGMTLDYSDLLIETTDGGGFQAEESFHADYIDVPVLARFTLPVGRTAEAGLLAGPAVAFKIGETISREIDGVSEEVDLGADFFKGTDLGLVIGGDFGAGPFAVDARYTLGLSNVYNGEDLNPTGGVRALDLKSGVFAFTFGYRLGR